MPPCHRARVAVLVPCLDEEQTVAGVVQSFRAELPGARIYVYDNGSTDRTAEVAAGAGATVRHVTARGKGHVVRRMFADVESDVYVLVDADGTYDPSVAAQLVELVATDGADLVSACRRPLTAGAYRRGHATGNRLLNAVVKLLFRRHFTDLLSGYRAMSRRFVKSFPALAEGFEIEAEIAIQALDIGIPIFEVPCDYRERPTGSSSKLSTYRDGRKILSAILRMLRQSRPLFFFGLVAVVFTAVAIGLGIPILETFARTHKVPRLPTAVLATGLVILGAIALTAGLVLDTVARARREAKLLRYLALPGPLDGAGRPDEETPPLAAGADPAAGANPAAKSSPEAEPARVRPT